VTLNADRRAEVRDAAADQAVGTLRTRAARVLAQLDLVGGADAPAPRASAGGDPIELLDPTTRAAYKERLDDLRDELDEAERFNDGERASRARRDIEFLSDELAKAVGLGGRDPRAAAAAERARVNVTRTITAVMKKIADSSPALGEHLGVTIRTGYLCSYSPDVRVPVRWNL